MTDSAPGADTPGPLATPAQEAHVRALLGTLRGEDVPMPDDVVARINAAVSAEQAAATLPDTPASLVDGLDGAAGAGGASAASAHRTATVSVLPAPAERRGASYAGLRRVLAVAAALVVVVGGVTVARTIGFGTGMSTSSGSASTAPEDAAGGGTTDYSARVSSTGTAYTTANLAEKSALLATGTVTESGPLKGSDAAPAPSGTTLDACVAQLTGRAGVTAVAVDSGTYDGAPAVVVVLPSEDDPASLDVWVLAGTCSDTEPDVLRFLRIPRP